MRALLDCGAFSVIVNQKLVRKFGLRTRPLPRPIKVYNADDSLNQSGPITDLVRLTLEMGGHKEEVDATVANIGDYPLIIGIDWLRQHNPEIDWQDDTISFTRCPKECRPAAAERTVRAGQDLPHAVRKLRAARCKNSRQMRARPRPHARVCVAEVSDDTDEAEEETDNLAKVPPGFRHSEKYMDIYHDTEQFFVADDPDFVHKIAASYTWSQAIAEKTAVKEGDKSFEEMVPPQYREFAKVFSKSEAERLPERKPYDHAIDLESGATPSYSKIYPMAPAERAALKDFIEDNLRKGYIRPSKSPAAAPVFFIKK